MLLNESLQNVFYWNSLLVMHSKMQSSNVWGGCNTTKTTTPPPQNRPWDRCNNYCKWIIYEPHLWDFFHDHCASIMFLWFQMLKLIILTALLSLAASHNPGFRTAVTAKGLNYSEFSLHFILIYNPVCSWFLICSSVDQVGLPILEQYLADVTVPDVSGSASIVVGSIDYEVTK